MNVPRKKRKKSLAHGRPEFSKKPTSTLSSKVTRGVINRHHQLHKQLAKAERGGDSTAVAVIQDELSRNGGLQQYQSASMTGQSPARGGDSSTVLVEWLTRSRSQVSAVDRRLRVLEVGALSVDNAISKLPGVQMTRIDLNSQHPQIRQQDFMTMPAPPKGETDGYDLVSLSLVVNYVPDAEGRGDMLKHASGFLRAPGLTAVEDGESGNARSAILPAVFLVLPAPCVTNSRYLDESRLGEIMRGLGYMLAERKLSVKLVYYLWRFTGTPKAGPVEARKQKVNDGRTRNNFCIVVR